MVLAHSSFHFYSLSAYRGSCVSVPFFWQICEVEGVWECEMMASFSCFSSDKTSASAQVFKPLANDLLNSASNQLRNHPIYFLSKSWKHFLAFYCFPQLYILIAESRSLCFVEHFSLVCYRVPNALCLVELCNVYGRVQDHPSSFMVPTWLILQALIICI